MLKRISIFGLVIVIYLFAPVVAGMLGYKDPRGPIIYPKEYHMIAYRIGSALVGKGKTRIPFTERAFIYGGERKPLSISADEKMNPQANQ